MTLTLLQLRVMFDVPFGALLIALFAGLMARRRRRLEMTGSVRGRTIAGGLVVVGVVVVERLGWLLFPPMDPTTRSVVGFAMPLAAALMAVMLLVLPVERRRPTGAADLAPRTMTSFVARGWLLTATVLAAVVLAVSTLAGRASIPDEQGRHRHYEVRLGPVTAGTDIYGWHYSMPSMILLVVLLVATFAAVSVVARPALADDQVTDVAVRRRRSRNVVAIGLGGLLIHLASVLTHLAGTAALRAGLTTDQGWISTRPPLVILETPMRTAGTAAELGGWFLWFAVLVGGLLTARSVDVKSPWHSASR